MIVSPNVAVVLHPHGASMLSIDLNLVIPAAAAIPCAKNDLVDAQESLAAVTIRKSMVRPKDEPVKRTLERIQMLLSNPKTPSKSPQGKYLAKRERTSREEILKQCPPATLRNKQGTDIPIDKLNEYAWPQAAALHLGDLTVCVHYNIPTVTAISPPPALEVGVPAVCSNFKTLFCKDDELSFEWRVKPDSGAKSPLDNAVVSTSRVVVPGNELLGRSLLFRCRPRATDAVWAEVETPAVTFPNSSSQRPVERWKHTTSPVTFPQLRVVTYNILHDAYCTSALAKQRLYPYCVDAVLELKNRRKRITQELQAFHGDIYCLQECGESIYNQYFNAVFDSLGFRSVFNAKTGKAAEGLCTIFRVSRFELLSHEVLPLSMKTMQADHSAMSGLIEREHPHLAEALAQMAAIGTVTVLGDRGAQGPPEAKPPEITTTKAPLILLANTHLYFHANACHIRALQAFMLLSRVLVVLNTLKKQHPASPIHVILCGDCNCTRTTAAYSILSTGAVAGDHPSWSKGLKYWWGVDRDLALPTDAVDGEQLLAGAMPSSASEEQGKSEAALPTRPTATDGGSSVAAAPAAKTPPTTFFAPTLRLQLEDAKRQLTPFPGLLDTHKDDQALKFTNYVPHFKEIIDHIFISSDSMEVVRTIPPPPEEELSKDVALPNLSYPSDHIPLIADVVYKNLFC